MTEEMLDPIVAVRARVADGPLPAGVAGAESYWHPSRVVVSAWLEHAPFAFWIMNAVRPATFVELGTHNGFSFFTFCEAADRLGIDLTAYAIDTWEGDDHAGFYGDEIHNEVAAVAAEGYADTAVLLRGYFDDFVGDFDDGSIDLLHIDGRHAYDDVKHDFESWLPKVSERGVVLFHDISERERGFGVWRLWDEVSSRYPSFHFEHEHGLGVLAVGAEVPPALVPLLEAGADDVRRIREFYSARGEQVARRYRTDAEMAGVRRELAEARSGTHAREVELDAALAELNTVRGSYSWRITSPLRRLAALVPASARRAVKGVASPRRR